MEVGSNARLAMQEAAVLPIGRTYPCDLVEFECQRQIRLL